MCDFSIPWSIFCKCSRRRSGCIGERNNIKPIVRGTTIEEAVEGFSQIKSAVVKLLNPKVYKSRYKGSSSATDMPQLIHN